MTTFYDPLTRKPKYWAVVFLIVVPVLLLILLHVSTKKIVDETKTENSQKKDKDVFERF